MSGTPGARRALVTGAARGLGEAAAERLVHDGWDVAIVDIAPNGEETAARLAALRAGARVPFIQGDVTDWTFCERAVAETENQLGGLDALVNNAGIGGRPGTAVVDADPADFRRVLDVNLVGPFLMTRAAGRLMIRQGTGGSIVTIGSILGQQGEAGQAAYCASKAGVGMLTQCLALELAPHGVRVNTIAPGSMDTEMLFDFLRARAKTDRTTFDQQLQRIQQSVPLGRRGRGADVAGAVKWLLSDDASYVTGQTIGVNGGVLRS